MEDQQPKKMISLSVTQVVACLIVVAVIVVAAVVVFISKPGESGATANDDQKTINEVKNLMDVADEVPSVATVLDKTKLSDQAFFANAEDGDKLLLYVASQQAVLYRPSTKKIIKVMPLIINDDTAATGTAPTPAVE